MARDLRIGPWDRKFAKEAQDEIFSFDEIDFAVRIYF